MNCQFCKNLDRRQTKAFPFSRMRVVSSPQGWAAGGRIGHIGSLSSMCPLTGSLFGSLSLDFSGPLVYHGSLEVSLFFWRFYGSLSDVSLSV